MTIRWLPGRPAIAAVLAAVAIVGCAADDDRSPIVRVATYNIQDVGQPGSEQYTALLAVLARIDADIVLLQEVDAREGDLSRLHGMAKRAGYEHVCVSETSGTLSGDLHNACLSQFPILECTSWSSAELSGDPEANDITRDILEAHVDVGSGGHWALFSVHLKGGPDERNRFRRQVEIGRLLGAIEAFTAEHPGSPVIVGGDFNEDAADGPFGEPVVERLPGKLPRTYRLGNDISFPVVYDPFESLRAANLVLIKAFHEDDPGDESTRMHSWRRLDYLWVGTGAEVQGAEVYDSCDDDGTDDPPVGDHLDKTGKPLPCKVTGRAADHFPVVADLTGVRP
jgi:endonuclease/exonuclease/phosphatase family metal-dependent hydrolase